MRSVSHLLLLSSIPCAPPLSPVLFPSLPSPLPTPLLLSNAVFFFLIDLAEIMYADCVLLSFTFFCAALRVLSIVISGLFSSTFDPRWFASRHSLCMFRPADQNCLCCFAERPGGADRLWPVHGRITPAHPARAVHRWRRIPVSLFPAFLTRKHTTLNTNSRSTSSPPSLRIRDTTAPPTSSRTYSFLLLRILDAGIPDSGLIAHLSEATAGSLNGVGHSSAYEELATYSYVFLILTPTPIRGPDARPPTDAHLGNRLAVKYLFLSRTRATRRSAGSCSSHST